MGASYRGWFVSAPKELGLMIPNWMDVYGVEYRSCILNQSCSSSSSLQMVSFGWVPKLGVSPPNGRTNCRWWSFPQPGWTPSIIFLWCWRSRWCGYELLVPLPTVQLVVLLFSLPKNGMGFFSRGAICHKTETVRKWCTNSSRQLCDESLTKRVWSSVIC